MKSSRIFSLKLVSLAVAMLVLSQTSCVVAGGYGSDGGWYIWPGSLVSLVVVAVVLFFVLKRRR